MTIRRLIATSLAATLLTLCLSNLSAAQSAPSSPPAKASLADFKWLVGHWVGTGLGGVSEEMWSPPAGGAMMGAFRQLRAGKLEFYELLILQERDATVVLRLKHFNADLTGWEEKGQVLEFPLVEVAPNKAVFNAMTFVYEEPDLLRINLRLRDSKTNETREERFEFKRVRP